MTEQYVSDLYLDINDPDPPERSRITRWMPKNAIDNYRGMILNNFEWMMSEKRRLWRDHRRQSKIVERYDPEAHTHLIALYKRIRVVIT